MDEISLSISVDLEPSTGNKRPDPEALARTVDQLIELFGSEGIAATWVAGDIQSSQLIMRVLEADDHHEAALHVPSAWLTRESGRSQFATEFISRKRQAEAARISVSTLAVDDDIPSEHLELLVRRGVTAIRTDRPAQVRLVRRDGSSGSGIAPLRYGLWQVACDIRYQGGGWLAERRAADRLCREIDRRVASSINGHLAIDAPALALRANSKFSGLRAVLKHIRRDRPWDLRVGTIAESVARLAAPKTSRSAQSILRAA
jgi:hypothetical protein